MQPRSPQAELAKEGPVHVISPIDLEPALWESRRQRVGQPGGPAIDGGAQLLEIGRDEVPRPAAGRRYTGCQDGPVAYPLQELVLLGIEDLDLAVGRVAIGAPQHLDPHPRVVE